MPTTFITVREFVAALNGSVNKNTVYAALHRKEIPSVRIGRRWLIPEDALTQMLSWSSNGASASPIPHQSEKS
jgi:excisionase family DNA binding protein